MADYSQEEIIDIFKKHLDGSLLKEEEKKKIFYSGNYVGAYIKAISEYIEHSKDSTLQGLFASIHDTTEILLKKLIEQSILPKSRSTLSLRAVREVITHLLHKYTSKKTGEEFETIKKHLVNITNDLYYLSFHAKEKIFHSFVHSIQNDSTILIHGYSSTISYCLIQAKKQDKKFTVYVTQAEPEDCGKMMEKELKENGIEVKMILDIAIGFYMKDIDCVLVGADAICQNGGVINKIGTFTIAICAKNFKKPFYVMSDSLKCLKSYPLDQSDIQQDLTNYLMSSEQTISCDYTPPDFITLLFTDIGIFTPSAISDELIQVFYT